MKKAQVKENHVVSSVNIIIERYKTVFNDGFLPNEIRTILDFFKKNDYPIDVKKIEDLLISDTTSDYITHKNNFKSTVLKYIKQ